MFTFRNFLRIAVDIDYRPKVIVFHKSNDCKSKLSVIKSVNTENKYLFGKLIETQKQRRAAILKNKKNEIADRKSSNSQITEDIPVNTPLNTIFSKIDTKIIAAKKSSTVKKSKKSVENVKTEESESEKNFQTNNTITPVYGIVNNKSSAASSNVELVCDSINTNTINTLTNKTFISKTSKNCVESSLKTNVKTYSKLSYLSDFPLENSEKNIAFSEPVGEIKMITFNEPEVKNKYSNFPSVSKIISATMSESSLGALKRWRTKMISELGEEGFQAHYKAQLNRGSAFHETIKKKLMGEAVCSSNAAVSASMNSLQWVWPLINSTVAVESHTAHPQLCYRGVIDCVAKFKDTPVVIEWKLSDKPKPQLQDTYDAPIQLSAYVGALNYDDNFNFQVNHGLVVVAYSSGSPADAFLLAPKHCQAYWKIWLSRLNKFNNIERLHTEHDIPALP